MNNNISLREKIELFAANDRFHMLLLFYYFQAIIICL